MHNEQNEHYLNVEWQNTRAGGQTVFLLNVPSFSNVYRLYLRLCCGFCKNTESQEKIQSNFIS